MGAIAHGSFTGLAEDYAKFRPDYSDTVLTAFLALIGKRPEEIDFVDVGAGTGIWTRMVARRGCRSIAAVEPNDDMRRQGEMGGFSITWKKGSGEDTGLPAGCCDFLTMASSLHWVDFDKATKEFHRVLRPGGLFAALWNPRYIEASPLLVEIEEKLNEMAPQLKRISSGRSGLTEKLTDLLEASPFFRDVLYLEGRFEKLFTPEAYLGVWRSVNDIRHQLGEDAFSEFLLYVEDRIKGMKSISCMYLTRAWCARRAG